MRRIFRSCGRNLRGLRYASIDEHVYVSGRANEPFATPLGWWQPLAVLRASPGRGWSECFSARGESHGWTLEMREARGIGAGRSGDWGVWRFACTHRWSGREDAGAGARRRRSTESRFSGFPSLASRPTR